MRTDGIAASWANGVCLMRWRDMLPPGFLRNSAVLFLLLSIFASGPSRPALADGSAGTGGQVDFQCALGGGLGGTAVGGAGGAGGTGLAGQAGANGQNGTGTGVCAAGGGGGGGGGAGGGAGGAGGLDGNGQPSGGAGGAGGANGATNITSVSSGNTISGGGGQDGQSGVLTASGNGGGGSGGGGAGGYGVVETTTLTLTNNGTIRGGDAGHGAAGVIGGGATSDDGDGGVGVIFTNGGTLKNSGNISGGDGDNVSQNTVSKGGAAVVGTNLTIIQGTGTITGGFGNGGPNVAVDFVGGSNFLQLTTGSSASSFNGLIEIEAGASLTVDQKTAGQDGTLGSPVISTFAGSGTLNIDSGTHTLTLGTGIDGGGQTTDFSGTTNLLSGKVSILNPSSLGTGVINFLGGLAGSTLEASFLNGVNTGNILTNSSVMIGSGNNATIESISGHALTLSGGFTYAGGTGTTLHIGSATDGGTIIFAPSSLTLDPNGALSIDGGGLRLANAAAASQLGGLSSTTISSGAFLDLNGFAQTILVLTGSGAVTNGGGGNPTVTIANSFAPGAGTPGGSMSISANLAFQSSALYLVQVNPAAASFATVSGSASLNGASVNANFAAGSYLQKQYTILTAGGGINGTFGALLANVPSDFHTSLSYDANDVFLNLIPNFQIPGGLNGNQQAVANALTNFFNTTGGIPMLYAQLSGAALSQASGELGTSSQQTTFNAMGQFMGLLTDPFMNRSGGSSSPLGYASNSNPTDAFAMFTKAPPTTPFEQRWSVWASGFGGSQSTDGNLATGSNNTTSSIAGTAVGADYLFSPNTIAGFALAGAGTNFSVANGGTGRSDLFQFGAYVRHNEGPAYISAALAYGWQDITTNRTVTIAGLDQLRAQFDANAYSGRVEGGYRFVSPSTFSVGITPYAAAQFVTFDLPAYAEQAISGTNNFALAYGAHDATDIRTELGIRTDKSWAMADGVLTLRGRFAWAHDYDPDRSISATFQALPGASFVVNGAAQAADSALTTASIEMKWKNGWSAAATFEGEFSSVTNSYAGKSVLRYTW